MFRWLKKLVYVRVKGNDNKVLAVKNGKVYKILWAHRGFSIKGNNNTLIFDYSQGGRLRRSVPKGLKVDIQGNNNTIKIEFPIKISDVLIGMRKDNNFFSIKSTPNWLKDAVFQLGRGASVLIGKNSEIGNGNLLVVCNNCYKAPHKLQIGDHVHIARDAIIRFSDGQAILDYETDEGINEPEDIVIGNHCWIMSRCMLVKGTKLPDNTAVAPYSFVNKKFTEEYTLLGGIPAKIIKHKFKWDIKPYAVYMEDRELYAVSN